jgi:MFS family permease
MVLGALVAGPVLRRVTARWVTLAGLLVMIVGLWQMAQWGQGMAPAALMGPLGLAGLGLGLVTTPLASAVLERVTEAERGIASSLLLVARLLGMTLGLSVLVTWALRRFNAIVSQVDISFTDPDAATLMAQAAVSAMTTVVTDLFFVTAIVGVVALLPALLLREEPRADV